MRVLPGGRGVAETAPEETDYCLSVSASVTPVVAVGVSASVSSALLRFSVSAGSVGVPEARGVAVSREPIASMISRSPQVRPAVRK